MEILNVIEKTVTNNFGNKKTPKKYMTFFVKLMHRKRIAFWAWMLFLPVGGVGNAFLGKLNENLGVVWGVICFASVAFITIWSRPKCPRCGKRFFSKLYFRNDLSMKCMNCGLGPRINDWDYYQKAIKTALKGWLVFLVMACVYIWFFEKR